MSNKNNLIENTTKVPPVAKVGPWATSDTGPSIEAQEARGQAQLALSDVLPTQGLNNETFKLWGIEIGEPVKGDPLFTYVKLPEGWTKVPTDHSMHTDLIDEKGRRRASIFYKAAFYDRRAQIHPTYRFVCSKDYADETRKNKLLRTLVKDGDKVIYQTEAVSDPELVARAAGLSGDAYTAESQKGYALEEAQKQECLRWLAEHFPDYDDNVKSWEYPETKPV